MSMTKLVRLALIAAALIIAQPSSAQFFSPDPTPSCTFGAGSSQLSIDGSATRTCGAKSHGSLAKAIDATGDSSCLDIPNAAGGQTASLLLQWDDSLGAGGEWKCIASNPGGFIPSASVIDDHSGYVAGHTDGLNCAAGASPAGVDASGAVQNCFDVETDVEALAHSGTVNAHHTPPVTAQTIPCGANLVMDAEGDCVSLAGGFTPNTDPAINHTGFNAAADARVAAAARTGVDAELVTGTAGATGECAEWDVNGDLISAGAACGVGGGGATDLDSVTDVTLTTPSTGATLVKSAGDWVDGQLDLADADAVTGLLPDANIAATIARTSAIHTNGADCAAGEYPPGVDAAGAVTSCTDATTEIDSAIATHLAATAATLTAGDSNATIATGGTFTLDLAAEDLVFNDAVNQITLSSTTGVNALDLSSFALETLSVTTSDNPFSNAVSVYDNPTTGYAGCGALGVNQLALFPESGTKSGSWFYCDVNNTPWEIPRYGNLAAGDVRLAVQGSGDFVTLKVTPDAGTTVNSFEVTQNGGTADVFTVDADGNVLIQAGDSTNTWGHTNAGISKFKQFIFTLAGGTEYAKFNLTNPAGTGGVDLDGNLKFQQRLGDLAGFNTRLSLDGREGIELYPIIDGSGLIASSDLMIYDDDATNYMRLHVPDLGVNETHNYREPTVTVEATATSHAVPADEMRNGMILCTSATGCTFVLPSAIVGRNACFTSSVAQIVRIDAAAGDSFILPGSITTAANAIDSTAAIGNHICLTAVTTALWATAASNATAWVENGP
jgi:hypothetical protein